MKKKIKNTSPVTMTIQGVGEFKPGDEKEVDVYIANQYQGLVGWRVTDKKEAATELHGKHGSGEPGEKTKK